MLPLLRYDISNHTTAFTTTREGGVSIGNYSAFNANHYCGDNPEHVAANRRLLCNELNIDDTHLIVPHQTHDIHHLNIDADFIKKPGRQQAELLEGIDALITTQTGTAICISTADCVPILIYDHTHHAAAAIHAGWRGTMKRIAQHTIEAMHTTFGTKATDCKAVIGPSISIDNFEVGDEVYDAFHDAGFDMNTIARRQDKWHIDLWQCNSIQLQEQGIPSANIQISGICTYQHHQQYFSARRLGIKSGRILTGIILH